jgi:hypothetical protein
MECICRKYTYIHLLKWPCFAVRVLFYILSLLWNSSLLNKIKLPWNKNGGMVQNLTCYFAVLQRAHASIYNAGLHDTPNNFTIKGFLTYEQGGIKVSHKSNIFAFIRLFQECLNISCYKNKTTVFCIQIQFYSCHFYRSSEQIQLSKWQKNIAQVLCNINGLKLPEIFIMHIWKET